jgi:flagellar basal-body rod protein FlgB
MVPLSLFALAAQKASWLASRQAVIAGNVANANTPGYKALDLRPFASVLNETDVTMTATHPAHLAPSAPGAGAPRDIETSGSETTLSGNSVNLEREMAKLGEINRDYALSTNIRRAFHHMLSESVK